MLRIFFLLGSFSILLPGADSRLSDAAMRPDRDAVRLLLVQHADINGPQGDGSTALHWAAFHDDLDLMKTLLAAGADVRAKTREGGITPLFMAATNGNAAVIDALLKAGADANSAKSNGTTVLMIAAAAGNPQAVELLLAHGADVQAKEAIHGQTALMFAAALDRAAVVKVLLAKGAQPNVATTVKKVERVRFDQDGNIVEERPVAAKGQLPPKLESGAAADARDAAADAQAVADALKAANDTARRELDSFARSIGLQSASYSLGKARNRAGDVAARGARRVGPEWAGAMTPLLFAAREGHTDSALALLQGGADINQVNADKLSPLVMTIMNGHYDLAKVLIEHGANPKLASTSGLTALYAAIDVQWAPKAWFPQPDVGQEKNGYLDVMKALIAKGADVNARINEKLWFRSFTNDYTWIDPSGATPFWRAAQSSDVAAMRILVEHGADPKLAVKSGDTPLHAAAGIGWAANWSVNAPDPLVNAVKYCVELGLDVQATDNRGYTALHGAAYLGNNEMVSYLVSHGAKIDARTKAGDTVADMANGPTRFGQPHPETVALAEKLGSLSSHNCRSDQCVVAPKATIYERPLSAAEQVEKDKMDLLAVSLGFRSAVYLVDAPPSRVVPGSK